MWDKINLNLSIIKQFPHIILCMGILLPLNSNAAHATDLTAGVVMDKMTDDQAASYVSGVIEGLAYARYVKDNPSETGMQCIYDWYYKQDNAQLWLDTLFPTFKKHSDKPVGVILYVLTKRKCGV